MTARALELAAAGESRLGELRSDVDVAVDAIADVSRRVGALERTLHTLRAAVDSAGGGPLELRLREALNSPGGDVDDGR